MLATLVLVAVAMRAKLTSVFPAGLDIRTNKCKMKLLLVWVRRCATNLVPLSIIIITTTSSCSLVVKIRCRVVSLSSWNKTVGSGSSMVQREGACKSQDGTLQLITLMANPGHLQPYSCHMLHL